MAKKSKKRRRKLIESIEDTVDSGAALDRQSMSPLFDLEGSDGAVPDKDEGEDDEGDRRPRRPAGTTIAEIDLHGMTAVEAEAHVDSRISLVLLKASGPVRVKIITGKGRHSEGGGVLVRAIYDFVKVRFCRQITRIDAPPAETLFDGLPLRGYFEVQLDPRK